MAHKPVLELSSGIVVKINKIPPLLVMELRKRFPAPKPPLQDVDYGDGKIVKEENSTNPKYLEELAIYESEFEERLRRLMLLRGLDVEVDKAAVEQVKAEFKEDFEIELTGTDREVYVYYVLIQTEDDLRNVIDAVLGRSQPTEAAVKQATDTFQPEVQG